MDDDLIDEVIAESTKRNPEFPKLVDDAYRKRMAARAKSSPTWMVIRVELLSGVGRDFDPPPGRDLLVSSNHTYGALAEAINSAFARWDLSHIHAFRIGEREIGTKVEDLDFEDDRRTKLGEHAKGSEFLYEFDFGDSWEHRCSVIEDEVDPDEVYGAHPRQPVPIFGWGDIPDQHGRRTAGPGGP